MTRHRLVAFALIALLTACTSKVTPNAAGNSGNQPLIGTAGPAYAGQRYDAGDFQIQMPAGLQQIEKDTAYPGYTTRIAFATAATETPDLGVKVDTFDLTAGLTPNTVLQSMKKGFTNSRATLLKDYTAASGETVGFAFNVTYDRVPLSGSTWFLAKGPTLYQVTVLYKPGKFDETRALAVAGTFRTQVAKGASASDAITTELFFQGVRQGLANKGLPSDDVACIEAQIRPQITADEIRTSDANPTVKQRLDALAASAVKACAAPRPKASP